MLKILNIKFIFLILITCVIFFVEDKLIMNSKILFGANMNNSFEKWSNFWITNASKEIFEPKVLNEGITNEKKRIARIVFDLIAPISEEFSLIVTCNISSSNVNKEICEAMCINRLLDKNSITILPKDSSQHIQELLKETFYLGIFTHLYLMNFPSRELSKNVNVSLLKRKWQFDAIAADKTMGYYGDPQNPILMNIWEYHYETEVAPALKKYLNPSSFKMGKFKSYFRNLYVSGALLVMYYDLSTKR